MTLISIKRLILQVNTGVDQNSCFILILRVAPGGIA